MQKKDRNSTANGNIAIRLLNKVKNRLNKGIYIIKHEHDVLASIDDRPAVFYFGIPMHSNMGDLAQCMCIRNWIQKWYPTLNLIEVDSKVFMNPKSSLRKRLRTKIRKEDIIIFQSGYCTQDLGGVEDLMHQAVMEDYTENRMLMMPQTVFFNSIERYKKASFIYDAHKHLLFLARDSVSYDTACRMLPHGNVHKYPDIVTTLIGKYQFNRTRNGILFCLRNDGEKLYKDEELDGLKERLKEFDYVEEFDTTIQENITAKSPNLNDYLMDFISKFADYKLVITDRYHGTIFSLVAQTPVIVLKTTDHKVQTGVDWFKGGYDNNVVFADSLDQALVIAKDMLNRNYVISNKPYFECEYYDKLYQLFEEVK